MSKTIRKCVGMGTFDTPATPAANPESDIRRKDVQFFFKDSGTPWVRFFVEWDVFQPTPTTVDNRQLAALDGNIITARQRGLNVVLCTYLFPRWANETQGIQDPPYKKGTQPSNQAQATWPDRTSKRPKPHEGPRTYGNRIGMGFRQLEGRFPDDLSAPDPAHGTQGSAYYSWLLFLLARYHPVNQFLDPARQVPVGVLAPAQRYIDFLEFVNEPNLIYWPQQAPSTTKDRYARGPDTAPSRVAEMFTTAKAANDLVNGYLNSIPDPNNPNGPRIPIADRAKQAFSKLLGPALSDQGDKARVVTDYLRFTDELSTTLATHSNGPYVDPTCGWSHHNYGDVADGAFGPDNRGQRVRATLTGRFAGYPNIAASPPGLWLTEGGYHRNGPKAEEASRALDKVQGQKLEAAIKALKSNTGAGAGIEMFTQFLFYTKGPKEYKIGAYDSGLCRGLARGTGSVGKPSSYERPEPYRAWKKF